MISIIVVSEFSFIPKARVNALAIALGAAMMGIMLNAPLLTG